MKSLLGVLGNELLSAGKEGAINIMKNPKEWSKALAEAAVSFGTNAFNKTKEAFKENAAEIGKRAGELPNVIEYLTTDESTPTSTPTNGPGSSTPAPVAAIPVEETNKKIQPFSVSIDEGGTPKMSKSSEDPIPVSREVNPNERSLTLPGAYATQIKSTVNPIADNYASTTPSVPTDVQTTGYATGAKPRMKTRFRQ